MQKAGSLRHASAAASGSNSRMRVAPRPWAVRPFRLATRDDNVTRVGHKTRRRVRLVGYASFAATAAGGNPAGVVTEAAGMDDAELQRVAALAAAPTTGFIVGIRAPGNFVVRFFTPKQEIDLCGHVTVALFSELAHQGTLRPPTDAYQHTAAGLLSVWVGARKRGFEVEMTQRLPKFFPPEVEAAELSRLLGVPVDPQLPLAIVSTGLRHLVVPYSRVDALVGLKPDFPELRKLSHRLRVDTIAAFALTASGARVRDLCPGIGDNEEAASGTTAGALAGYLFHHGVIASGREVVGLDIEQGIEMNQPSQLRAELTLRADQIVRVAVRGRATRLWERELSL